MRPWEIIKKSIGSIAVTLFVCISLTHAQNSSQSNEVYLTFQYRGIVSNYVTAHYKDNEFYLPVSELFSVLKINHHVDQGALAISGIYLGETKYLLDFNNQKARAGETKIELQADDFLIKEIDYFVKPAVLEKLFDLKFTTNFSNLTLDLSTDYKLPVVAQYEREQERQKLNRERQVYKRSSYPLQYDRQYSTIDGAFLDYNLSAIYSQNYQLFTFSNSLGAEFLAGDVQGNIFGAISDEQRSFTTTGLRWRYVRRNSNLLSSVTVGQTNSEGISSRAITGIKISNKPVEPRLLFDRYPIEGDAPAQSEVELYLNNRLVDYQKADESGRYRFLVPLTYGNTNYSVRIFTPEGHAIEHNDRIQIPFDFLPPGEIDYSISGGRLENPILGSNQRGYIGEASLSGGITNWLTVEGSTEYLTDYHSALPSFTGTLNARLFSNYLISADVNSENFYRLASSVVYNSGASWSLSYDYNPGNSTLYNIGGSDHLGRINLFTPVQIGSVPLNLRWSSTYQTLGTSNLVRYRADLSTRLGRMNIRFGYQDQQTGSLKLETTSASRLTNSYTYSVGRYHNIPKLLRGLFIRGQLSYLPGLNELEEMEFQLSRDLLQTGRIQLAFGHNFLGDFNSISLNVTIDLNKIRSNTTTRTTGSDFSVSQNFRGSIGYDSYGNQLLFNNRQQVGQAGTAVRLFVDNNNDGVFQEGTDDVITDPAVRLNRAGGRTSVKNEINYISQLLPYNRYDMEINTSALSNPLLVPDIENFSIVTDPNQYKPIEIPFYLSGVISGKVEQKKGGELHELGGVRLYLESDYDKSLNRESFSKELRTFSDGSFYTYKIPPGDYHLFVDSNQLEFLQAESQPDTIDIEIKSLAQGDFIEGLHFTIVPKKDSSAVEQEIIAASEDASEAEERELYYKIQLASFKTERKAKQVALEAAKNLGGSFSVVHNTANGLYGIRSIPMSNRKQAVETIISYHNSNYTNAALVVLKNEHKKSVATRSKFIQIGAFSTKKRAEKFAGSSSRKLGKETAVTFNKDLNLYKVYINQKFSSDQTRDKGLATVRNLFSYKNAFINEHDKVQIGAFSSRERAEIFARESENFLHKETDVFYDSGEDLYNVQIDEDYSSAFYRGIVLAEVKNTPSPFNDAFISEFDEISDPVNTGNKRAMEFTFKVEIEGVTEESEQAFISSLTSQNSDTQLKRPEEDKIIFDNVSTWQQAMDLQRKLSKISTIGHPIVILIEES